MSRAASIALILLVAVACAPRPLYVRSDALRANDAYVFYGLDFSRARFSDAYFRYEDLLQGKVPRWNEWVSGQALAELSPIAASQSLQTSVERNRALANSALTSVAAPWAALPIEGLKEEVAPYVDGTDGKGILVVVECLSKANGVAAHTVVFDRKSGELVLVTQETGEGDGFGVYDYYRTPLAAIAKRAVRSLKREMR
jgi:hypothetical protein